MHRIARALKGQDAIGAIYVANGFLALHAFLIVYANSTYLSGFVGTERIGLLYVVNAAISLVVLAFISRMLRFAGNFVLTLVVGILALGATAALGLAPSAPAAVLYFLLYGASLQILIYSLDIYLETYNTSEEKTGNIRGIFLTITNIVLLISPFVAGMVLGADEAFSRLYLVAAAFLLPFVVVIGRSFRHFVDPPYHSVRFFQGLACFWKNANLRFVILAQFALRIFYAWMVVYLPLYLNEHIGFSWPEIGIIFPIMLLPFVLLEFPLGRLADRKYGEKEIMTLGFIVIGFATIALSFITTADLMLWAIALFLTRIGASMIEITTESYFFKHVDGDDAHTISWFRMTRPGGYLVGPGIATLALVFLDIQYLFAVLGLLLLVGIVFALRLVDTK